MWEPAPTRSCKMKTEKQISDLALQVMSDSNGQFQWSRDDESLTGECMRVEEKKWKNVNTDNSSEGFCCKVEGKNVMAAVEKKK